MSRPSLLFLLLLLPSLINGQNDSKPKLVVGVVIDQMRQDYLTRFADHYGEDGFKRIQSKGFSITNAHYNYVPTETGPGHASIYTGSTPKYHGIIANNWYVRGESRETNCVEDRKASGVGNGKGTGNRSPDNLIAHTLTDQIKMTSDKKSKVISLSIKDRGAILPGGHNPDGAYWYDHTNGEFMTSTYYTEELPAWLIEFNKKKLADEYMSMTWETLKPIEKYTESADDNRSYEKPLHASIAPVFPYDLPEISKKRNKYGLVPDTPFGNSLITELALTALNSEKLGQGPETDFLAISYSSTDYIGHDYGPLSKEIQDTYIRMDLELARLFRRLDEYVGEGNWTLFLTADHGVAEIPYSLIEKDISGGYLDNKEVEKGILAFVKKKTGRSDLIEEIHENQIFLDREKVSEYQKGAEALKSAIMKYVASLEGIAKVVDLNEISDYEGGDKDLQMIKAGLNSERSGDILYFMESGWLPVYYEESGTGHGSFYEYDTHVPMIFYGQGIVRGTSKDYQPIVNITPTIAHLLGIDMPESCVGKPIPEVLLSP